MVSVHEACADERTIQSNRTNPLLWGGVAVDENVLNRVTRILKKKQLMNAFKGDAVSEYNAFL